MHSGDRDSRTHKRIKNARSSEPESDSSYTVLSASVLGGAAEVAAFIQSQAADRVRTLISSEGVKKALCPASTRRAKLVDRAYSSPSVDSCTVEITGRVEH